MIVAGEERVFRRVSPDLGPPPLERRREALASFVSRAARATT
jgi:hypothetical protein